MALLGQPGLHETNRLGAVKGGQMTNQDLAAYAALLLRVSLAVMFYAHAWLKIKVFTPAGTAKYFESLGVPGFLAYLTIFFFSSRRRHTRSLRDWSSDVCSSD